MKMFWPAVLLCAGAVIILALAAFTGQAGPGSYPATRHSDQSFSNPRSDMVKDLFPARDAAMTGNRTALFAKTVAPDTRYIVVSLYSGDPEDPISVTVITPDKTLGPFYDGSDGIVNGRIDLKISNPDTMTPGQWKFLIRSNKNISYGSLENLSWIRTGTDDHKADE